VLHALAGREDGSMSLGTACGAPPASGDRHRIVEAVDYLMTDKRVQRIREEPVQVAYNGHVLLVRASERLSRVELVERRAELEIVCGGEVVAYIARDSDSQRQFWTARTFDVGVVGVASTSLMEGIDATLGLY
jgi:hypothetical protein